MKVMVRSLRRFAPLLVSAFVLSGCVTQPGGIEVSSVGAKRAHLLSMHWLDRWRPQPATLACADSQAEPSIAVFGAASGAARTQLLSASWLPPAARAPFASSSIALLLNSEVKDTQPSDTQDAQAAPATAADASHFVEQGTASWYGGDFHGQRTANGERYNMNAMTAAHRSLPLSSYVKVTNASNNRSVIVRINDRGPYVHNRVIDLSFAAAKVIGLQHTGVGRVVIKGLSAAQAKAALTETKVASGDTTLASR